VNDTVFFAFKHEEVVFLFIIVSMSCGPVVVGFCEATVEELKSKMEYPVPVRLRNIGYFNI
jgi:hypothetical protein